MAVAPLVFIAIFIGIFLAVEGIYLLAFGRSARRDAKVNRRLDLLEKGDDPMEVLTQLRKERERHISAANAPLVASLFDKAAQANIPWSPRVILTLTGVISALVCVGLVYFAGLGILLSAPLALGLAYGAMFFWLSSRAKKRLAKFEEQLPEAIELMVRALRIGHPFSSAIALVAQEMPDPIGTEFGIIADEAIYGLDINDSLDRLADRVAVADLRFLAVAVAIQSQSGGNLAEILAGLANVVRSRFKLFRKVKAITAESRWSGIFLSAFPVLALIVVQLIRPNYYDGVVDHPFFVPATIVVGVMLAINVVFMRMMVNIKV